MEQTTPKTELLYRKSKPIDTLNMIDGIHLLINEQQEAAVEVKKSYSCTIKKDDVESAYTWLRENGLEDIIKNEVFVTFGKGEDNKAKDLLDLAEQSGYEPQQKSKVEPMTLKALYRERVEAGLDMPSDSFHLFVKDQTKISRKK